MVEAMSGLERFFEKRELVDIVKYTRKFTMDLDLLDCYDPMYKVIMRNRTCGNSVAKQLS